MHVVLLAVRTALSAIKGRSCRNRLPRPDDTYQDHSKPPKAERTFDSTVGLGELNFVDAEMLLTIRHARTQGHAELGRYRGPR